MGEGTGDKVEGQLDQFKGKTKEGVGDALDDESMESEGERQQVKGQAKETVGDVKNTAEEAKEDIRDALK